MIIHYSAVYIYTIFCGSFLIISNAENIDVLMAKEIARRKQWKEILVVHCLETKFQEYSKWRNLLGPFVFMQWINNTHVNEDLFNKHASSGNLPIIVLPRCSPLKVSRLTVLRKAFTWWFFHDREDLETFGTNVTVPLNVSQVPFLKTLENQKISFESDVNVVIVGDSKCHFSFIWAVYPAPNSTALQAKLQATWNSQTKEWISQQSDQVLGYSRKELARSFNLNGIVLRVGVIEARSDYEYDCHVTASDQENSATLIGGYSAHILNALQKILHFKVQIITSDTWGSLDHEGVWTGLIGLLTEDKIDIALCHPTITVERADAVSFLLPTIKSDRVLVYQTSSLPITQDVFVRNFSKSLWLCLLLLLFLLAACLRLTTLVSANLSKGEETSPWSWIEIALWTVAATCQQGSKQEPKGPSSSAVFLVGYLTLYLVYTAFAAGVTSQLAVQGRDKHLQLADTRRMHLHLVTHSGTLIQQFLQSSKDLAAQNILKSDFKRASNHLQELEHLMVCVKCGHCVAISSRQVLQHHLATKVPQDEACQLTTSRIDGSRHYKAIALQKHSPYVSIFNYWILRLLESGTISVEYSRSINHVPQCDVGPGYSSAGIGNVVSGVIILILGILFSLLLLGAEKAWYWHVSEHNWQLHVQQEIRQKLKIV